MYQVVNGTSYHEDTPQRVVNILENLRHNGSRLRIHYGDTDTGRDWMDENDVTGYVGRSGGSIKIPLLIHNSRSSGGGGILDHCIVKITTTCQPKRTLYIHPKYHEA